MIVDVNFALEFETYQYLETFSLQLGKDSSNALVMNVFFG